MSKIKVSVLCTAYNHEKYIEKCLQGIIDQKTNFEFEILINDDHSDDKTADLIRMYESKYPKIIKPVYQTTNQYSKGINIVDDILFPKSKGEYIAFCEGDDYWIDEHKLQRQYEFMENHKSCVMCVGNTIIHDLENKEKDRLFNHWRKSKKLKKEDIFLGWNVHTSTYFIRRNFLRIPDEFKKYWFGDYVRLTYNSSKGDVYYIPDIMSVYNHNNTNGLTNIFENSEIEKRKKLAMLRIEYLKILKENFGCDSPLIDKRIRLIEYDVFRIERGMDIRASNSIKESIKFARNITRHPCFKEYMLSIGLNKKIKTLIKYRGYYIYPLWIKLWRENKFN